MKMLQNTEKMKSSTRNVSVHKRFINLNNSTLERKVIKAKRKTLKKFAGIKFRGSQNYLQFPRYLYSRSTLLVPAKIFTVKVIIS